MLSKELLRIIPQFMRVIRRLTTAQLDGSTTLQQLRIMIRVSEDMNQSQIADSLQISLPAVSKSIATLHQRGLVSRSEGQDKRSLKLKLTAKGKRTLTTVMEAVENELAIGSEQLSQNEKNDLLKGILSLDKILKKMKEE